MTASVERQTLGFSSFDRESQIKGLLWQRPGTTPSSPRGIVQIVHGMSEYVGRYESFAHELVEAGYVVCGSDHIGHGNSVESREDLGHMPLDCGKYALVEDVHALRQLVSARYARNVPYFLFGHSMGSFITRVYIARHGQGLAGAVICATGNKPTALSRLGVILARCIARRKGERAYSSLLRNLADGAYAKAVKNPRTPFDWLSRNSENVDAYIADELCGQPFTVGAYAALIGLAEEAGQVSKALGTPSDLPVLFIAGEEDPVGENGKGVQEAADILHAAGVRDIIVRLYPGMRHEILNEDGKDQVIADVVAWLDERVRRFS